MTKIYHIFAISIIYCVSLSNAGEYANKIELVAGIFSFEWNYDNNNITGVIVIL